MNKKGMDFSTRTCSHLCSVVFPGQKVDGLEPGEKLTFPVAFGAARLWRGRRGRCVAERPSSAGTGRAVSPVMEGPLLVHGEREKEGLPPVAASPPIPLPLPPENPSRRHCIVADVILEEELIRRGSSSSSSTGTYQAPWRAAAAALARSRRQRRRGGAGEELDLRRRVPGSMATPQQRHLPAGDCVLKLLWMASSCSEPPTSHSRPPHLKPGVLWKQKMNWGVHALNFLLPPNHCRVSMSNKDDRRNLWYFLFPSPIRQAYVINEWHPNWGIMDSNHQLLIVHFLGIHRLSARIVKKMHTYMVSKMLEDWRS